SRSTPRAVKHEACAGVYNLFRLNCIESHGENGAGIAKNNSSDLRLSIVQQQSDGTLFWKITNGNADRGMPSFSRLPELQRWQLVLYLRKLKTVPDARP